MNEKITKAFEGRWRIKFNQALLNRASAGTFDELADYVKGLCLDFFQAAWLLNHTEEVEIMDADFETWWNLYQKKRGREKCMKKWAKLSAKDRQACIQATPAYVQSTPDVTYRKDPYTYLNNKSWNDTIYFRNNTDLQRQQRLAASADLIAGYAAESNRTEDKVPETH
jgi:hypothetical protein